MTNNTKLFRPMNLFSIFGGENDRSSSIAYMADMPMECKQKDIFTLHKKKVEWAEEQSKNPDKTLICNHCDCKIPFDSWSCCKKFHDYNDLFHPLGGHLNFHYMKMCIGEGRDKKDTDKLKFVNFAKKYFVDGRCACGEINFNQFYGYGGPWTFAMMNPDFDEEQLQKKLIDHIHINSDCMAVTKDIQFVANCIKTNSGKCKNCNFYLNLTTFDWDTFEKKCRMSRNYLNYLYYHSSSKCTRTFNPKAPLNWVRCVLKK
jgi:hypothetical protein